MNSTILDYFFDPSSFQLTSTSTTTFSFLNFHGSILSRGSSPCWLWIVGITGFTDSLTVDSFASSFVHIFIHSLMNIVSVNIEVNFMWAAHQVHHSSEDYNLTTALRQSAMQRYNSWVSTHQLTHLFVYVYNVFYFTDLLPSDCAVYSTNPLSRSLTIQLAVSILDPHRSEYYLHAIFLKIYLFPQICVNYVLDCA